MVGRALFEVDAVAGERPCRDGMVAVADCVDEFIRGEKWFIYKPSVMTAADL